MPKPKPLTKEMILAAMNKTKSNRAGARYLNVSYQHYKKWAKLYESDKEEYKSLFDEHLNQAGVGIPKFLNGGGKEPPLLDIIEGRVDASSFSPEKIKYRLVTDGHLEEKCNSCGFQERRVLDYKMPLLLHFKDNNKKNYRKENIQFLCYNCYYLSIGDLFTNKQIEGIEDHKPVSQGEVDWEVDDYTKQRLEELGLGDIDDNDEYDIISRI
tara:strand:+ start:20979 stop:21614 length:636 start_codon:yes stop_codon:yes gene_type:complete